MQDTEAQKRQQRATWAAAARQQARERHTPGARDVGLAVLRLLLARAVAVGATRMDEVVTELERCGYSRSEAERVTEGLIRRAKNTPRLAA